MPTIIIVVIAGVALFLFSKTSEGTSLLNSVSPITWYVPSQDDLNQIQNNYPEHDRWRGYALHSLAALQITTDLFDPKSRYCQGIQTGSLVTQKIGQGIGLGVGAATALDTSVGSTLGLAVGVGTTLGSIASAATVVGLIATPFIIAFGMIHAHHAAAVSKENAVACPIVPAINAQLSGIDSQLRSRKITGAQAMTLLLQLQSNANEVFAIDPHAGIIMQLTHVLDGIIKVYQLIIQKTGV